MKNDSRKFIVLACCAGLVVISVSEANIGILIKTKAIPIVTNKSFVIQKTGSWGMIRQITATVANANSMQRL
jgi:hypothetical protein